MDPKDDETVTDVADVAEVKQEANLRRRSSVGRSIRRSQSTNNGLTFEDQLLVLVDNGDIAVQDKIARMVNLSVSATCRSLLRDNDRMVHVEPGSADDKKADVTENLASFLGQRDLLLESHLQELALKVERLKSLKGSHTVSRSHVVEVAVVARLRDDVERRKRRLVGPVAEPEKPSSMW